MAQQKRAVIYLRVSGKKQDTMTQLIDCREYCEVHNLEIVEEIPDKISGNSSVIERSGGARVYELLRNKTADLVLLWKIDRVTRDEDITEYMVFKRDVKRIGAELHFCDIGRTSDDPMGAISEFSQAAGAAKERLNIIERTSKGRRKKFNYEKRLVLNGEAPFGYHKIGIQREAQLVIDDVESAIVRDVFRWYVTDRLDLWEILKRVSASGTKPRRTVVWNKRKMIQILHYQEYKGTFKYSGQTMVKPELTIIDSDTWESAQMFLKGNQWLHDKTGKYLMAGRVKCTCDHTLTGSSADKLHYYRCHKGWSYPPGSEQRCKQARIRVEKIDKTVWGGLVMLCMQPDNITAIIDDMRKGLEKEIQPLKNRIDSLNPMIAECDSEVKQLIKRLSKIDDDEVARLVQDEIDTITDSKRGYISQREKSQAVLDKYGFLVDGQVDPNLVVKRMNQIIRCKTFEDRRRSLEEFNVRVQLVQDGGELKIKVSCYLKPDGEMVEIDNNPYRYVIGAEFEERQSTGTSFTAS